MHSSTTLKELFSALAKAQGEFQNPNKNAFNPHYKNWYTDLAELLNAIRPILSKHGLAVMQPASTAGGRTEVKTYLTHESGEYMIFDMFSCPSSKDGQSQGIGSDITYLRRYQLCAIFAIAQEDLDGEMSPAEIERDILQKLRDASLLGKKAFDETWQQIPKSPNKEKVWNANKEALIAACYRVDNEAIKKSEEEKMAFEREAINIEIELAKEEQA
jgi:hypothetical protein